MVWIILSNPATNVGNPRPVPALGSQDMTDPSSYSSYNALQVGLTHRASANLVYQFSYTYSHCIDSAYTYGGLGFNNVSSAITNPYDLERGQRQLQLRSSPKYLVQRRLHVPLQGQPASRKAGS